ncbi:MAG: 3'(2'),5'-bisphosphate nucleotidase CysQ [Corynebacterium sp.]|nr:3'(2'),5'-bisphosphate nucleotidase CysQ [Corynebacterium sp.]
MTAVYLDDLRLARRLAEGAGDILRAARIGGLLADRTLGDAGDQIAQAWIARVLEIHRPEDGVLSEEAADDLTRLKKTRTWIIDPLDGTLDYSSGSQDWGVHIALVEAGIPTKCAVSLPDLGTVFSSGDAKAVGGPLTKKLVVSKNHEPEIGKAIADKLGYELNLMGSAGAKCMHVLLGDYDAYIHSGGQYEWDSAAPIGVCMAAGLHCSRLDGSPLRYNNNDTFVSDFLVCRKEIADELLEALAAYKEEHGHY